MTTLRRIHSVGGATASRLLLVIACLAWSLGFAQDRTSLPPESPESLPTIAEKTAGMRPFEGYFDFWWDDKSGKIWLVIQQLDEEFLYVNSLSTGLGSNPVGLDRGQLGRDRIVRFTRIGPQIFLQQRNLRFRANTDDARERQTVEESFAQSILWSAEVVAQSEGRMLVDVTDFLLRDAHNVAGRLKQRGQRDFRLDEKRSAIYLERTKSFPKNSEFEVMLTFESSDPGPLVVQTTPSPEALTLRLHHSFVQLPDGDYRPRAFDPRAPCFRISFADYASPIDQPLQQRWITRHRLKKKFPQQAVSEPVEPIVYYVDPGAPEPIRSALLDGARWWNEAFESAGFKNAFQVELLPPHADPLDVRYNVIMWVHRATRGWSYGNTVIDPRTGEIIKGHVTLGSLRVRQDLLLLDGLRPPVGQSSAPGQSCGCCCPELAAAEVALADLDSHISAVAVVLARIRQLSAHEVGHTLGFAHNFAASTYDRASVMDYPAPRVRISAAGQLDLSDAYGAGIGAWDQFSVQYAYSDFRPEADEAQQLRGLIDKAIDQQLLFLSDADARPAGAAHPLANLWDNGADPIQALRHSLQVRQIAIKQFDPQQTAKGLPLGQIEAALVPLYLHHRYQVDATAKLLGGAYYSYAVEGDRQRPLKWVDVSQQHEALGVLLECIAPKQLVIPERILRQMPPPPFGYGGGERFSKRTAMLFDPLAAAEVAADMVISNLLQPQRAARLMAKHNVQNGFGLDVVLQRLLAATWHARPSNNHAQAAAQRVVRQLVLKRLMQLAGDSQAAADVRAVTTRALRQLNAQLKQKQFDEEDTLAHAHRLLASEEIERFLNRPHPSAQPPTSLEAPPGSPIGTP